MTNCGAGVCDRDGSGVDEARTRGYLWGVRYPIGNQDFRKIRTQGKAYVDKTEQIARVLDVADYLFLARPRRFGKSLTVSTIAELHSGDRELFDGLWAYDNWDFEGRKQPVLWFEFASIPTGDFGITEGVRREVYRMGRRAGVSLPPDYSLTEATRALIELCAAKSNSGRVAILIDEYDNPITDVLEFTGRTDTSSESFGGKAVEARDELRNFYSVFKDSDRYIDFLFVTGVSAFSKVSLFSHLNNLYNISLDPIAQDLVGLTEEEVVRSFSDGLSATGVSLQDVRDYYNGYRFGPHDVRVYNPWALLHFLQMRELEPYWYQSGSPKWLTRYMAYQGTFKLEDTVRDASQLLSFGLDRLDTVSVLYQTGYLTISSVLESPRRYRLDYPNIEVKYAFTNALLEAYVHENEANGQALGRRVSTSLLSNDLASFVEVLNTALAGVPYQLWRANGEAIYHIIAQVLVRAGVSARFAEVSSAKGRADLIVQLPSTIYVFEFKINGSVKAALSQISERGYGEAYAADSREVVGVGISFDTERRQVGEWKAHTLN